MNKSDKILITGATGFLGSYILRLLVKKGYQNIVCTKREKSKMGLVTEVMQQVEWVDCGILETASLEEIMTDVDYVIHAAAIISLDPNQRELMYKVNVEGTANIVNICILNRVKKLIHISSIAAIGRNKMEEIISEKTEWQDGDENSHYAISKLKAEMEVWRGSAEGLNIGIINPSLIIGAGYWDNGTAGITKRVQQGIPFYPAGSNGFCDVRDVAIASLKLLESEISNERIIISNQNLSYKKAFELFARALKCKAPTRPFKKWIGAIAWRAEIIRSKLTNSERLVTKESIQTTASNSQYDNSKSIELLDMKYRNIEESIQEICKSYLESDKEYEVQSF